MGTRRGQMMMAFVMAGLVLAAGLLGATPAPAQQGSKVTLRLWLYGTDQDMVPLAKEYLPIFEKENPNIKVEWAIVDWATAREKVTTAYAGGTLPDVFTEYSVNLASFADRGLYAPLEKYVDEGTYRPATIRLAKWKGHLYAIPVFSNVRALHYRKDFLKEAGINGPPKTWAELTAAAKALTRRDGAGNITRSGFWVPTSHPYKTIQVWIPFMWSNGGRFFSEDGCQAAFNRPEGVEALRYLSDLLNVHKVDFPGSIVRDNTDWAQGKVALMISNFGVRKWVKDFPDLVKAGVAGFAPTPHNEGKTSVSEMGANYFVMASTSKQKDEAAKLLKFLTTSRFAIAYAALDHQVPAAKGPEAARYMDTDVFAKGYAELIDAGGRGLPRHPRWTEINDLVTAAIDQVYLKARNAQQAMDDAATQVNRIIAESKCGEE
jgi:multiple sugar transport system substrate-binding protein